MEREYLCLSLSLSLSHKKHSSVSQGSGSSATIGTSVWDDTPSTVGPTPADFKNGLNTSIVANGYTITVSGGSAITASSIEVGQGGGAGTLTIGDNTSAGT